MACQTATHQSLFNLTNVPQPSGDKQIFTSKKNDTSHRVLHACRGLTRKQGIHSSIAMNSAGFKYTTNGDTARCDTCGLEVSEWTLDMKPFVIHSQRSPTCPFVLSILPSHDIITSTTKNPPSNDNEPPYKRLKTDTIDVSDSPNTFVEVETLKQIRKRTFSHWPRRSSPSSSQMIEAGFFKCNVGDRVICIYCNIICQQWTPNSDDPSEVHKTLSPKCAYVIAMLNRSPASSIVVINEQPTSNQTSNSINTDSTKSDAIVYTAACNTAYIEIPKRYASFATWSNENAPPVDDLVKAGFFFTGIKTIVTCFYCNGSLQDWGLNDNPTIEHARWFPNCAYAKQLCGAELHRKIQESKRTQQNKKYSNNTNNRSETNISTSSHGSLDIPDENTLSRLVAARLDLPISQKLLDRQFKGSIIKRCWEDQLRLKREDFVSDSDLSMACTILQKQIEGIDGKQENIIVPSVAMRKIQEKEQVTDLPIDLSNSNDDEMTTSSSSESTSDSTTSTEVVKQKQLDNKLGKEDVSSQNGGSTSTPANPCVLCLDEEKRLACIPCGHLATCVPCGHSLRSCPICRQRIDAFVRIYI